jgi:ubiquinol-cytochrome c reductase cytochrome b subunit
MKPAEQPWVALSQIGSAYYFAHFLIILPLVSKFERPLPLPNSISESVLHGKAKEAAPAGLAPAAAQ